MGQPDGIFKAENGMETICRSKTRILLHCPDITLKGKNQSDFRRRLLKNARSCLAHAGKLWHVGAARGRMLIDVPDEEEEIPPVLAMLQKMPGISSLASASWLRSSDLALPDGGFNWPFVEAEAVELAGKCFLPDTSFAIQVNRADKALPVNSMELGKRLGETIRRETPWNKVNLSRPGQVFYIDIYPDGFYMYTDKLKGVGGLLSKMFHKG